ncbi:hypothetical protein JCM19233_1278 [Vibrio astriarenae]|nr:hypothetical protein JCM19233_1278 [Vibrio sp. C7]
MIQTVAFIFTLLLSSFKAHAEIDLECPVLDTRSEQGHHFESDFSSLNGWGAHFNYPHSAQIVADPIDNSNQALRIELQPGDVFQTRTGEANRAEIYETYRAPFNAEMQYRFRILISDEWQFDNVRALIAQWHATPDRHLGEISRSPNLGIELRDNRFLIRGQTSDLAVNLHNKEGMVRQQHYLSKPIKTNHWYQFEVDVVWTPQDSGFLRVSIDDEVVVNFSGPTSYLDCVGPYFKTGIYRDDTPNTFVMFVDDYSRKVSK